MSVDTLVNNINTFVVKPIITILFAAGFLFFAWGVVEFLFNLQKGGPKEAGKKHMMWGIVGMVVMLSAWGIIRLIAGTIGVNPQNPANPNDLNQFSNVQFR